jgi:hypothetical protein
MSHTGFLDPTDSLTQFMCANPSSGKPVLFACVEAAALMRRRFATFLS